MAVKSLSTTGSPYTYAPSDFSPIMNLKPDLQLQISKGGTVVVNLPAISALQSGSGQVSVIVTDGITAIQFNTGAAGDSFVSQAITISLATQLSVSATGKPFSLLITSNGSNIWTVSV